MVQAVRRFWFVAGLLVSSGWAHAAVPCAAPVTGEAQRRPEGCDPWAFSNGERILRQDGTPIDPLSDEGAVIERLIDPGMSTSHVIHPAVKPEVQPSFEPASKPGALPGGSAAAVYPPAPQARSQPRPAPKPQLKAQAETVEDPMRFSNGDHISRGDQEISPTSGEGQQIEAILERQRRDRAANAAQKELFWKMTNAKNAAEVEGILAAAKARDPNAGTPNVITRHGKSAAGAQDDDPAYRFSNGKRFSGPDGKLIRADSPQGREIEQMLAQQQRRAEERAQSASSASAGTTGAPRSPAAKGKDPMRFSNGNRIRRKDGSTIDPGSREGGQIEAILRRQHQDRVDNAAQKELFWKMTNAKNAAEANAILKDAQRRDPHAGTPNVITKRGSSSKR